MKKTIRKPDGTVIEYEGTAEELKQLEPLQFPPVSVPSVWTTPPIKGIGCDPDCFKCNGKPWFGVIPPTCSCMNGCWGRGFYQPTITWDSGIVGEGCALTSTHTGGSYFKEEKPEYGPNHH